MQMQRTDFITIRRAGEGDRPVLERLAALDSRPAPKGEVLIAEVGDETRAAIEIGGGAVVADPFWPTADLVVLLRVRAARLRDDAHARRPMSYRRLLGLKV